MSSADKTRSWIPASRPAPVPKPAGPSGFEQSAEDSTVVAGSSARILAQVGAAPLSPTRQDALRPYAAVGTVGELRARMAAINEREYALRCQDRILEQRWSALQQNRADPVEDALAAQAANWAQRLAEFEQETLAIDRRRADTIEREQLLDHREQDLELLRRELQQEQEELQAARETLQAKVRELRAQRSAERQTLQRRLQTVRDYQTELEQRFAEQRIVLENQRQALENREADLAPMTAEIEHRYAQAQQKQAQLDELERDLQACVAAAEQEQQLLESQSRELEGLREQLARERARIDADAGAIRARQAEIERAAAGLGQRDAQLERRSAELAERWREYDASRQAMELEEIRLAEHSSTLSMREEELAAQRAAVDEMQAQCRQRERDLDHQRDELYELRRAVESREAEARQAAAALEIERSQVEALRMQLDQATGEFTRDHSDAQRELKAAQRIVAIEARRLQHAPMAVTGGPVRWVGRGLFVAGLLGAIAGGATWWLRAPEPYWLARIMICPARQPFEEAAAGHLAALRDPAWTTESWPDAGLAESWRRLMSQGRIRLSAAAEANSIDIQAPKERSAATAALLAQACAAYVQHYRAVTMTRALPPSCQSLQGALNKLRIERDDLNVRLANLNRQLAESQTEPEVARPSLRRLQDEQSAVLAALRRARGILESLTIETEPRGVVKEDLLLDAVRNDPTIQQDTSELALTAEQYHAELIEALRAPVQPGSALASRVRDSQRLLQEQLALSPPADVARAIEASVGDVSEYATRVDEFNTQWAAYSAKSGGWGPKDPAAPLLTLFDESAELARKTQRSGQELLRNLRSRLDSLRDLGGGSTREVVVLNAVHAEAQAMAVAVNEFAAALQSTDLGQNFELDALDRQMRSLQRRLVERPEAIRAELQAEADQRARERNAQELASARQEFERQTQRRDELAAALIDGIEAEQKASESRLRRAALVSEHDDLAAAAARRQGEIAALQLDLDAARREITDVPLDDLAVMGVEPAPVDPDGARPRLITALRSGFVTAGGVLLTCLLMAAGRPGTGARRRAALARIAARDEGVLADVTQ